MFSSENGYPGLSGPTYSRDSTDSVLQTFWIVVLSCSLHPPLSLESESTDERTDGMRTTFYSPIMCGEV